jgi:N-methylhydantoinase B/oxoprolinase/acetone carboxylase alpha subunit
MDDGTPIKLAVTIDRRDGSAIFDFEGTGNDLRLNTKCDNLGFQSGDELRFLSGDDLRLV